MNMYRVRASGRARCKICGKKIEKGVMCIHAIAYNSAGYCHMTTCDPMVKLIEDLEK